jgi:dienelactone hydrolase
MACEARRLRNGIAVRGTGRHDGGVARVPGDYERRDFGAETSGGFIVLPVYRRKDRGPTVILIHEVGGISAWNLAVAERLADERYTVVLPEILRPPGFLPAAARAVVGVAMVCVGGLMAALTTNRTGMIVEWLRALARDEAEANDGRAIGVVGMCLSGGFALGVALEPSVAAGVLSQPSLPFPVTGRHRTSLGVSEADLAGIRRQAGLGERLRIMRFALDAKSPAERYDRFVSEFPACSRQTIPTDDPNDHSVLATAVNAPGNPELDRALRETLEFLAANLGS